MKDSVSHTMVTLALSKGRIFDEVLPLLAQVGLGVKVEQLGGRELILPTANPAVRVIIVRASDVPTYVGYGAADLGIVGADVLLEQGVGGVYQPIALAIGRCRLCVAARAEFAYADAMKRGERLRVATKYPNAARTHFSQKGVQVDLIKLYGSMELAPLVGLSDVIVDLVSTGNTLRANGLIAVEEVVDVSARLVVSRVSMKTKMGALAPVLGAMSRLPGSETVANFFRMG